VTKAQAIERVKKLIALANGSKEPNERASASRRAAELKTKFGLSDSDLQTSDKVAAFDELVGIIGEYSSKHPELQQNMFGASQIIEEVLSHSKRNLAESHKTVLLDKISKGLDIATFIVGTSNPTLNDIKGIVECVLKSHNLTKS
jgi:carboxylesterase type B